MQSHYTVSESNATEKVKRYMNCRLTQRGVYKNYSSMVNVTENSCTLMHAQCWKRHFIYWLILCFLIRTQKVRASAGIDLSRANKIWMKKYKFFYLRIGFLRNKLKYYFHILRSFVRKKKTVKCLTNWKSGRSVKRAISNLRPQLKYNSFWRLRYER